MAHPTPRRFGKALVATVLCAVAVSGCDGSPPPQRPEPRASARPDATEVGWIQLAIAMDQQARHLLLLAPERSGDRDVERWASEVAAGRGTELTRLRALLARRGVPDGNPHEGHDMPGMVDARELRALRTARGRSFDRLLRSALREHLEQARRLAAAVQRADVGADVRKTAFDVGASATDALRRMPPS
ncbi:DUF305 domain-containing protein [Streptomyces djakartensis]|uniref:DUF305 domain-containing protein n=1 Tax=Streptomyces djakartensis TaxID=68193 RepID=UPI0034DFACF2